MLLLALQEDLVDEVDDGLGRLLGVVLGEQVALVAVAGGDAEAAAAGGAPGHEAEDAADGAGAQVRVGGHAGLGLRLGPVAVLGVQAAVGDGGGGEVLAEEAAAGAVRQCYALG